VPTVITHAFVGTALGQVGPPTVPRWRLAFALAVLSVLPDLDVVAFHLHIPYDHWLGHRGLSHSLLFAIVVAAVIARVEFRQLNLSTTHWWAVFGLCFVALASHGPLDALTDGGLGVAFFLPFDNSRYFFPVRPLKVSPIGLSNFLGGPALAVLRSEFVYVWLPVAAAVALVKLTLHRRRAA
jgi:inner membrane protein